MTMATSNRFPRASSSSSLRMLVCHVLLLILGGGISVFPNHERKGGVGIVAVAARVTSSQQQVEIRPIRLHGLNYNTRQGIDWDPNRCKSYSQVLTDLSLLRQITNRVRVLSLTDCGQGRLVLQVCRALGMQVWLGMWVSGEDANVFQGELNELRAMLDEDLIQENDATVIGITVGSEVVYREELTATQMVGLYNEVKAVLSEGEVNTMPVAIVDVDDIYEQFRTLFENSDVVYVNAFPFWENQPVNGATDYLVDSKMPPIITSAATYGKEWILGETGWSSQGDNRFASDATPANQAQYFQDFYCRADLEQDWSYYYFTGIDNTWRVQQALEDDGITNGVEGHFGMFYSNLTMKPDFASMSFTCPVTGDSVLYEFQLQDDIPIPDNLPTPSPVEQSTALCSVHPQCAGLGGNCCPTLDGELLGCCSLDLLQPSTAPPSLQGTTAEPTVASTSTTPNPTGEGADTEEPTLEPTATTTSTTTESPSASASTTEEPTVASTPQDDDEVATEEPTLAPTPSTSTATTASPTASAVPTIAPSVTSAATEAPSSTSSQSAMPILSSYPSTTPTLDDDEEEEDVGEVGDVTDDLLSFPTPSPTFSISSARSGPKARMTSLSSLLLLSCAAVMMVPTCLPFI